MQEALSCWEGARRVILVRKPEKSRCIFQERLDLGAKQLHRGLFLLLVYVFLRVDFILRQKNMYSDTLKTQSQLSRPFPRSPRTPGLEPVSLNQLRSKSNPELAIVVCG